MNNSPYPSPGPKLRRLGHASALAFTLAFGSLPAAQPPLDDLRLVVAQGAIVGISIDGKPARATLRNLADELMRRYPAVTINITGVDNVEVEDLTLRVPKVGNDHSDAAVLALLTALAQATEGEKFVVSRFGENQFLLSRPRNPPSHAARSIEVFNLKLYLEGRGDKVELENEVRRTEQRLVALDAQLKEINRKVGAGLASAGEADAMKNAMREVEWHHQMLRDKRERLNPSKGEITRRLDRLINAVQDTLAKFSPAEKRPEFEYHSGSYLLVVIGSEAAIDVTRKVVTALEKSSD